MVLPYIATSVTYGIALTYVSPKWHNITVLGGRTSPCIDSLLGDCSPAPITPNFPFGSSREIVGIMLRNRCWPTTFFTITVGDADGWCRKCPVWSAPQPCLQRNQFTSCIVPTNTIQLYEDVSFMLVVLAFCQKRKRKRKDVSFQM